MDALKMLLDSAAIIDVVNEVAIFADLRQWGGLRGCYADEVDVDYTSFVGGQPAHVKGDDLIAGWKAGLGRYQATQHMLGNHRVKVDNATATCLVYVQAKHWLPSENDDPSWTVHGYYDYVLVRTGETWRITQHKFTALMVYGSRVLLEMQGVRQEWLAPQR